MTCWGCAAGKDPLASYWACPLANDSDLAKVLAAWPALPCAVKAGIAALVQAVAQTRGP